MKWLIRKISNGLNEVSQYLITFGSFGLFAIALLDSAFLPLPGGPDAVLMLLAATNPGWMLVYALIAALGSTAGCVILYYISRKAGRSALERFSAEKRARVQGWIERYDILSVLVAAVLPPPFPFKLFVVTAGVFQLPVLRFAGAVAAGRAFRFFLEAYLAARYGEQAKELLTKYYPAIGLGVAVLLVAVFAARQMFRKKEAKLEAGS